jgi:iron uptake system component EfeO
LNLSGGQVPHGYCKTDDGKKYSREKQILCDRRGISVTVLTLGLALVSISSAFCEAKPASDAPALQSSAADFRPYVLDAITRCLTAVKTLRERIDAQDLAGAQQAWLAAREGWEGSEVVTSEFFPQLDRDIDGWPDADKGFHAIEAKLFGAHDVKVSPAAAELVGNLEEFKRRLQRTTLTPQGLMNGATKLVFEIGEDKAQGGESPYSGNSLAEIRENLACIEATYQRVFAPVLRRSDASAAKSFSTHIGQLRSVSSVATLQQLDQVMLRDLSESLANDLVTMSHALGLQRPQLGN